LFGRSIASLTEEPSRDSGCRRSDWPAREVKISEERCGGY
jgi:hypothetical protein